MNTIIAQMILTELGLKFDSHSFIRKLLQKYPEVYGERLIARKNVNLANGEISSFLSRNATELKIKKICDDFVSQNIIGNDTANALWEKI